MAYIETLNGFDLSNESYVVPDKFDGTDVQKVQAALDSLVGSGGILVIDRDYLIDSTIQINLQSDTKDSEGRDKRIYVVGLGGNAGFTITANAGFAGPQSGCGGLFFTCIRFRGSTNASTVAFDTSNLVRLYFTQCTFDKLSLAFQSETGLMQSVDCEQCQFKTVGIVMRSYVGLWAAHFSQCTIENSEQFIVTDASKVGAASANISINGCTIEGMAGSPLTLNGPIRGCVIDGCYFEANGEHDMELSGTGTVTVTNCYFEGADGRGCILLPAATGGGSVALAASNNTIQHGKLVDNSSASGQLQFVDVGPHGGNAFLANTTNTVNINEQAKSYIDDTYLFTSSSTLADTGYTLVIPPYSWYVVTAMATHYNSAPSEILISTTVNTAGSKIGGSKHGITASATAYGYTASGITLHVLASYANVAQNQLRVFGIIQRKLVRNGVN